MNETSPHRDASGAHIGNVILGIWVVISPFVLGFSRVENAKWNNIVTGGVVALLALSRRSGNSGVLNILLGGWLIASSFVLQFTGTPYWNNIILGICIVLVALIASSTTRTPTGPAGPNPPLAHS